MYILYTLDTVYGSNREWNCFNLDIAHTSLKQTSKLEYILKKMDTDIGLLYTGIYLLFGVTA